MCVGGLLHQLTIALAPISGSLLPRAGLLAVERILAHTSFVRDPKHLLYGGSKISVGTNRTLSEALDCQVRFTFMHLVDRFIQSDFQDRVLQKCIGH